MINTYKEHIKKTVSLAYPVAIGQLGHIMLGVVDNLFVGRLGAAPLAAASIANSLFFLILVLGLGFTYAISPLVAIATGRDNVKECGNILRHAIVINMIAALTLTTLIFTGSYFLKYLNQPQNIVELSAVYLRIIGLSVIPMMLFQTFRQFIEGLSIMRPAMIITILANLLNALGNYVLIYGKLGIPALGFEGSALATLLTRITMAIVIIIYFFRTPMFKKYSKFLTLDYPDWQISRRLTTIGLSSGFQYFFEAGAFSSAAIMIGWIGTNQLAAHQIALNLASIVYMGVLGISAGAAIRVGNFVGRGDIPGIRQAGLSAIILGGIIGSISGLTFILLRKYLPYLYIDDTDVLSIASSLLIIAGFFQISDAIQAIALGCLRGITDVKIPTLITFVSYWLLGLPTGYLFAFYLDLGVQGVWFGFIVGLSASAILLSVRFYFKSREMIRL